MKIRFLALLLFASACGAPASTGGIVGVWQATITNVVLTTTLSGNATSGPSKLSQQTMVGGDLATCRADQISDGSYDVSGSSITFTVTSAHQVSSGCSFPDSDTPITDLHASQNYATALSGPFVLTDTTLKLGMAYPTFTRSTR